MKALRHWMLHNDALAKEFDDILSFSPGYNPVRNLDPAIVFYAPLVSNVNDMRGVPGNFGRTTEATGRNLAEELETYAANMPRFETVDSFLAGIRMEGPSTNKCQNFNVNPDVSLVGWTKSGDASAALRRTADVAALSAAKLQKICTSGYVIDCDNSAGSVTSYFVCQGPTGNTNRHVSSAYWRGTGTGAISMLGPDVTHGPIPSAYERASYSAVPASGLIEFRVELSPGAQAFVIFNQFEEQQFATSPIITTGAASSRQADIMNWGLASDYLNNAQGMCLFTFTPEFSNNDLPISSITTRLLTFTTSGSDIFVAYEKNSDVNDAFFNTTHSVKLSETIVGTLERSVPHLIALIWDGVNRQLGYKKGGVWNWSVEIAQGGNWTILNNLMRLAEQVITGRYTGNFRDLTFWNVNRGRDWIEDYSSEVAE